MLCPKCADQNCLYLWILFGNFYEPIFQCTFFFYIKLEPQTLRPLDFAMLTISQSKLALKNKPPFFKCCYQTDLRHLRTSFADLKPKSSVVGGIGGLSFGLLSIHVWKPTSNASQHFSSGSPPTFQSLAAFRCVRFGHIHSVDWTRSTELTQLGVFFEYCWRRF